MSLKFKFFYEKYYMNKPESSSKWHTTRARRNPIRAYATPSVYRQASFVSTSTTCHDNNNNKESSTNVVPLLRCSTAPILPTLSADVYLGQQHHRQQQYSRTQQLRNNKAPIKQNSLFNVFSSSTEKEDTGSHISASPSLGSYSARTSRVSSSISRCSSKASWSDSFLVDEDDTFTESGTTCFADFINMSKPYSFVSVGPTASSSNSSSNEALLAKAGQLKNVSVSCNSVMGNPKKLGRRLIRRGSATEIKEDSRAPAVNGPRPRPPMLRTKTADNCEVKLRCSSNENVAESQFLQKSANNHGQRTFVKQKSSADLSLESNCNGADKPLSATAQLNKLEKKRLEKLKNNMKNLLDLFTAVEQDDIGTVRSTLQHNDVDINGSNMDDLTLLDVAIMHNHNEVAVMLLKFGAQENPRLTSPAVRLKHLQTMIDAAQTKLAELNIHSKQNSSPVKNIEKQISSLESRVHMLKKMRNNFENSGIPDPPRNVVLQVASANSLLVSFESPEQNSLCVVTKYKIEWTLSRDFCQIEGSLLVKDLRRLEVTVNSLAVGDSYFVRISSGNFKGFSEPTTSHPSNATPSSWRELDGKESRSAGRLQAITELYHELNNLKSSNNWQKFFYPADSASKKKKNSFKNIFLGGSKFLKSLKRGVYLASVLYKDDKILCTVDENLPIIEVDETQPSTIIPDYLWFMKLSCAWDDMKSLNFLDLDQIQRSSASLMFRMKLLEAASSMQAALGVQDLGRLHCSPIIDNRGVTIFVTVQYVHDQKSVQGLTVKWLQIGKLFKRLAASTTSSTDKEIGAMELLSVNLLNVLNFYESTYIPLDRGLYLGFVKLHSTMNQISIVVPENLPSVLPFFYIRDNPHVSKEEWEWLRVLDAGREQDVKPTSAQLSFHWALSSAAKILLSDLDVHDRDIASHRIYRLEVVEVHPDVSFILLVPSHQEVCSAPGQQRTTGEEKRGCFALPVPMFEVAHLCTYQPDFIALYCRLSVFLEFFTTVLQQMQRQTLNDAESKHLKQQLEALTNHQLRLDDIWKTARWISSVATSARDKHLKAGLTLGVLFEYTSSLGGDFRCETPALACESQSINYGSVERQAVIETTSGSTNSDRRRETAAASSRRNDEGHFSGEKSVGHFSGEATGGGVDPQRPWRRRQRERRHRSNGDDDRSLSDRENEDSSDVGYHSDQSVEKSNNSKEQSPNAKSAGNVNSNLTDATVLSSHCNTEVFFSSGKAAASGLDNPIYDFLTPKFFFDSPELKRAYSGGRNDNIGNIALLGDIESQSNIDCFVSRMNSSVQRCYQSKMLQQRYGAGKTDNPDKPDAETASSLSPTDDAADSPRFTTSSTTTYRTNIAINSGIPCRTDSPVYSTTTTTSGQQRYGSFASLTANNGHRRCSTTSGSDIACVVNNRREYVNFLGSPTSVFRQLEMNERATGGDTTDTDDVSSTGGASVAEMAAYFQAMSDSGAETSSSHKTANFYSLFSAAPPSGGAGPPQATRPASAPSAAASGLLRVYAAYQCGLAKGTSVKLQVSQKTTAKEVVNLVVQQLNKAVKMKGLQGPCYAEDELGSFCLAAVIGARERCLRDDFAPLDLQNPWSKGKLFVRKRNDVLAALEFGNEAKV